MNLLICVTVLWMPVDLILISTVLYMVHQLQFQNDQLKSLILLTYSEVDTSAFCTYHYSHSCIWQLLIKRYKSITTRLLIPRNQLLSFVIAIIILIWEALYYCAQLDVILNKVHHFTEMTKSQKVIYSIELFLLDKLPCVVLNVIVIKAITIIDIV